MPKILLTYWWNGHEPGDVVETDDQTARDILGVVARPVEEESPESDPEPEWESEPQPESGR